MYTYKRPLVMLAILGGLLFFAAGQIAYAMVASPHEEGTGTTATNGNNEILVFEINRDVVQSDRGFPKDHPPKASANGDWTNPVNFADGTMYYRMEVREIPRNQDMQVQFCVWQDSFSLENCGERGKLYGKAGAVITWSQPVQEMWKKDGKYIDWSRERQRYALVIRNQAGKPVSNNLGWDWYGENPDHWYPMDIRFTTVVVAKGATFSGWQNYGGSGGGGGGNPPTPTPTATPPSEPIEIPDSDTNIYVSSSSNGFAGDLRFRDEDILGHDPVSGLWWMLFDGSDVGIKSDINGFTFLADGSILLTLNVPATIPGLGRVDDSDVVRFAPDSLGEETAGTFTLYLDGSDIDLSTGGEDIDALSMLADGSLLLSTYGNARSGDLRSKDEDLLRYDSGNANSPLTVYFDGSEIDLTRGSEDIWAATVGSDESYLYFSTSGNVSIPGADGTGSDIIVCHNNACQLFWEGATHGFGKELIDGLYIGAGPQVTAAASAADFADDELYDLEEFTDDDVLEDENGEEIEQIYIPLLMR